MITFNELETAIKQSWCVDTCYNGDWYSGIPEAGQCISSVMVVYKHLGGDIFQTRAIKPDKQTLEHYYNLIDGKRKDITKSQFPDGTIIPDGRSKILFFGSIKDILFRFPKSYNLYAILDERVEEALLEKK